MLATVEIPGGENISLPSVCLPYSPEFKPAHTESGVATMERLATVTGGQQRINLSEIWDDLPRQPASGIAPTVASNCRTFPAAFRNLGTPHRAAIHETWASVL